MKSILLIAFIALVGSSAQAQWHRVNSGTTENLYDIFFVDSLTGYCVGGDGWGGSQGNGVILKTEDGGENWIEINELDSISLGSLYYADIIHFKNANNGIINTGKHIYKTDNGGITFNRITFPPPLDSSRVLRLELVTSLFHGEFGLVGLSYVDRPQTDDHVFRVWKTYDYGENWQLFPFTWSSNIYLLDSLNWFGANFRLYKTHDGGITWDTSSKVYFSFPPNSSNSWYVRDTTGRGMAILAYHGEVVTLFSFEESRSYTNSPFYIKQVEYIDDSLAFCLSQKQGPSGATYIAKTIDDGQSFSPEVDTLYNINDIEFYNTKLGWACGDNGVIYKTINGGGIVGINEWEELKKKIEVFPNPVKGLLRIEVPDGLVIKDTELLNLEGREVKRFKKGLTVLKVSDIPAGPYVLRINTSEGVFTEKVVVE